MAHKVARLDPLRAVPSVTQADGRDFVKTNKFVLFGHHFAAISASGPLIGPVLAAQFGYLPGALWILFGAALGGAVHDFIILFASVRHGASSLSEIVRREIGSVAHGAGDRGHPLHHDPSPRGARHRRRERALGLALGHLHGGDDDPGGAPLRVVHVPPAPRPRRGGKPHRCGAHSGRGHRGAMGREVFDRPLVHAVAQSLHLILPVYAFIAATLPVWLLLCPRDYLSTYMKIGTIALLVVGRRDRPSQAPHASGHVLHRRVGPGASGMKVFPFCFIVIACGAISGFHALIGSGTTPRMVPDEPSIRFIGYGAMLTEGLVAIMALVAATTLAPADYFLINGVPKAVAALGIQPHQLQELTRLVGEETLQGRTGGAVSLAVGMANILRRSPAWGTSWRTGTTSRSCSRRSSS
jgi:carbon starvation protein